MDVKVHPTRFAESPVDPLIKNFALSVSLLANEDYTLEFAYFKSTLDQQRLDINNLTIQSMFVSQADSKIRLNKDFIKKCGIVVKQSKKFEYISSIVEIHQVIVCYNRVRNIYHHKKSGAAYGSVPLMESTPQLMKDADNLIIFLKTQGIDDYYLYLYTVFASTFWGCAWSIKASTSPKAFDLYQSWKDRCAGEMMQESLNASAVIESKNPWFNIYPHIEERKKRLLANGHEQVCMSRPDEFLGFHPKSEICKNCPIRGNCASSIYSYFQTLNNTKDDILLIRSNIKE